ncbi:MAG TPA: CPBP family intramembrane glutamic endopeptidase, partial [Polyangiales bacterium]
VGADRDLARTESVLEWWFTFPVSARGLLLSRALGVLVAPILWVCVLPFFWVIFWCAGLGAWWGLLLALCALGYVGALAGALRVVLETGLGWLLPLRRVAFVQTGVEFFGLALLMLGSSASVSKPALAFALRETRGLSWWTVYNPLSLPLGWLVSPGLGAATGLLALAVALLTIYAAVSLGSYILRDGLIESTGPLRGPRGRRAPLSMSARVRSEGAVLVRHELLSLTREPARLVRVVVLPLLLVGVNMVVNPQLLEGILTSPRHAATIAFGIGAFSLSTTGLCALANEGHGLWLLYTLPSSIVRVLARKALVWSSIAAGLGATVLAVIALVARNGALFWSPYAALALVGVLLHGVLAVALGTLGTNVFETERANRVQPLTVQLFMLLAIMFGYAIYAPSIWGKFVQLCMSSLLAFALWQKVHDHAPYFLDPTELPPPRIAVSDGLLTALGFFVMQGCLMLMLGASGVPASIALLFAFVGAGVIVAGTAVYGFVRMGVPDLMVALGVRAPDGRPLRAVLEGALAGVIGGAFALGVQQARARFSWLQFLGEGEPAQAPAELATMLAVLAVCAAPPLEELIFRGIIHRGFRRSLRPLPAVVASSLIFALVHPPVAFVPVFVMALLAATVFERSRLLIGAMTTHMVYNAIIVGAQWWMVD